LIEQLVMALQQEVQDELVKDLVYRQGQVVQDGLLGQVGLVYHLELVGLGENLQEKVFSQVKMEFLQRMD